MSTKSGQAQSDFSRIWLTWWLGDASGALTVEPFLILYATGGPARWSPGRKFAGAVLVLTLLVGGLSLFGGLRLFTTWPHPFALLAVLCFPLLSWSALRFGPRTTSALFLVLSALAIWGVQQENGLLINAPPVRDERGRIVAAVATFQDITARRTMEKMKDEFLSLAAHELKTPLAVMRGNS